MTSTRPLVLECEDIDPQSSAWLAERCDVRRCGVDDGDFETLLSGAQALVVRTYTRVDAALLDRAPRLQVVGRAGVGVDNIDLAACAERGVAVVHTPDANGDAVTELVFALLLDALRPRLLLDRALEPAAWSALRRDLVAERQLRDCTLGIVGFGRVGRRVGRIATAFGMPVRCHDLAEIPEAAIGAAVVTDLDALLAGSDIVTVHVDDRPGNRHLVDTAWLARMRPDAILANTSRGFVVDAAALAAWLGDHPAATAILDVHDPEPIESGSPLLGLANARCTPHIGAATRSAHSNMSRVVEDVWRVLSGESPRHPVQPKPLRGR